MIRKEGMGGARHGGHSCQVETSQPTGLYQRMEEEFGCPKYTGAAHRRSRPPRARKLDRSSMGRVKLPCDTNTYGTRMLRVLYVLYR